MDEGRDDEMAKGTSGTEQLESMSAHVHVSHKTITAVIELRKSWRRHARSQVLHNYEEIEDA